MAEQFLATNIFPGDGHTTLFNVSFKGNRPDAAAGTVPYLSPSDVKGQIITPATATTPESAVDVALTYVGPNQFSIASPCPVGKNLRIYRSTQDEYALVDYQSLQTVGESDLDLSNRQTIFVVQEAHDLALESVDAASDATTVAYTAVTTANNASTKADTAIATANNASGAANSAINTANAAVTTAGAAQTAANNAVNVANTANTTANTALDTANDIAGTAQNAVDIANAATDTANNALDVANGIDSKADAAIASAATANNTANTALATANGIDSKAQTALDTANAANNTAGNALSQANTANTTANQALTTANGVDTKATSALNTANSANSTANTALSAANAAMKTFKGRAPDGTGNIAPLNGDYSISQITGGQDASQLTSGTLPTGRLTGTYGISVSGNAATATTWQTARTLTANGDMSGSVSINGGANVTLTLTEVVSVGPAVPTFSNSWGDADTARFRKKGSRVQLSGLVQHAYPITNLQTMFVLPVGCRPSHSWRFICPLIASAGLFFGACCIQVSSDGVVQFFYAIGDPSTGNTNYQVDMSAIEFEVTG